MSQYRVERARIKLQIKRLELAYAESSLTRLEAASSSVPEASIRHARFERDRLVIKVSLKELKLYEEEKQCSIASSTPSGSASSAPDSSALDSFLEKCRPRP